MGEGARLEKIILHFAAIQILFSGINRDSCRRSPGWLCVALHNGVACFATFLWIPTDKATEIVEGAIVPEEDREKHLFGASPSKCL
jgi:hypothetical protein